MSGRSVSRRDRPSATAARGRRSGGQGSAMIGWAWSTKRCSSSVSLIRPTHSNHSSSRRRRSSSTFRKVMSVKTTWRRQRAHRQSCQIQRRHPRVIGPPHRRPGREENLRRIRRQSPGSSAHGSRAADGPWVASGTARSWPATRTLQIRAIVQAVSRGSRARHRSAHRDIRSTRVSRSGMVQRRSASPQQRLRFQLRGVADGERSADTTTVSESATVRVRPLARLNTRSAGPCGGRRC